MVYRYRFQYDGRLARSLETGELFWFQLQRNTVRSTDSSVAVMLMETFDRLTRKDKYVWDVRILNRIPWLMLTVIWQIYGHVGHNHTTPNAKH